MKRTRPEEVETRARTKRQRLGNDTSPLLELPSDMVCREICKYFISNPDEWPTLANLCQTCITLNRDLGGYLRLPVQWRSLGPEGRKYLLKTLRMIYECEKLRLALAWTGPLHESLLGQMSAKMKNPFISLSYRKKLIIDGTDEPIYADSMLRLPAPWRCYVFCYGEYQNQRDTWIVGPTHEKYYNIKEEENIHTWLTDCVREWKKTGGKFKAKKYVVRRFLIIFIYFKGHVGVGECPWSGPPRRCVMPNYHWTRSTATI